jgi:histidinol-phosphate aminotransferase
MRRPPGEVFRGLAERGVLIRDVSSYPMLDSGLRVTIGKPEENEEFLRVLKEVL